jgi:hypothetical protein
MEKKKTVEQKCTELLHNNMTTYLKTMNLYWAVVRYLNFTVLLEKMPVYLKNSTASCFHIWHLNWHEQELSKIWQVKDVRL